MSTPLVGQDLQHTTVLEIVATELTLIRGLLEKQLHQSGQFELLRVKAARIGAMRQRLDDLQEQREADESLLRELNQSLNATTQEDRPAIEKDVQETNSNSSYCRGWRP
jgi:hypothetical protein